VKFLIGAARRDEWVDKKFAGEVKALARIDDFVRLIDFGIATIREEGL
jgi:hypothetical protein